MTADKDALETLYPFLHGARRDAESVAPGLAESIRRKAEDGIDVKRHFFAQNEAALIATARALAAVYRGGGRLFTMGNGGSSCDAAHIAVEFQHPVTAGRPALPATNLGADTAFATAVGNDVGFAQVYRRQIEAQARPGDGLVGISTSGNSANLMAAFEKAKQMRLTTVALAGMDGGAMANSACLDHCLVVQTDSIHRIQECHVAIYHILWDLVHTLLADERGGLAATASGEAKGAAS